MFSVPQGKLLAPARRWPRLCYVAGVWFIVVLFLLSEPGIDFMLEMALLLSVPVLGLWWLGSLVGFLSRLHRGQAGESKGRQLVVYALVPALLLLAWWLSFSHAAVLARV